jgi:hypothetical protein
MKKYFRYRILNLKFLKRLVILEFGSSLHENFVQRSSLIVDSKGDPLNMKWIRNYQLTN